MPCIYEIKFVLNLSSSDTTHLWKPTGHTIHNHIPAQAQCWWHSSNRFPLPCFVACFLTIIIPWRHLSGLQLHLYVLRNREETLISRSFSFLVVANLKLVDDIDQMLDLWLFSFLNLSFNFPLLFTVFCRIFDILCALIYMGYSFFNSTPSKAIFLWWLHACRLSLLLLNLYALCNVPFCVHLFQILLSKRILYIYSYLYP